MKVATLGLFYFVKYLELTFLLVWTTLLIISTAMLIDEITKQVVLESKDTQLIVLTCVCAVLAFFNVLYNNLLINLRFKAKMKCVTFGLCLFDCANFTMCYCFLVKPCRDRCFTPWTLGKWLVKGAIFGYTIYLVRDKLEREMEEF